MPSWYPVTRSLEDLDNEEDDDELWTTPFGTPSAAAVATTTTGTLRYVTKTTTPHGHKFQHKVTIVTTPTPTGATESSLIPIVETTVGNTTTPTPVTSTRDAHLGGVDQHCDTCDPLPRGVSLVFSAVTGCSFLVLYLVLIATIWRYCPSWSKPPDAHIRQRQLHVSATAPSLRQRPLRPALPKSYTLSAVVMEPDVVPLALPEDALMLVENAVGKVVSDNFQRLIFGTALVGFSDAGAAHDEMLLAQQKQHIAAEQAIETQAHIVDYWTQLRLSQENLAGSGSLGRSPSKKGPLPHPPPPLPTSSSVYPAQTFMAPPDLGAASKKGPISSSPLPTSAASISPLPNDSKQSELASVKPLANEPIEQLAEVIAAVKSSTFDPDRRRVSRMLGPVEPPTLTCIDVLEFPQRILKASKRKCQRLKEILERKTSSEDVEASRATTPSSPATSMSAKFQKKLEKTVSNTPWKNQDGDLSGDDSPLMALSRNNRLLRLAEAQHRLMEFRTHQPPSPTPFDRVLDARPSVEMSTTPSISPSDSTDDQSTVIWQRKAVVDDGDNVTIDMSSLLDMEAFATGRDNDPTILLPPPRLFSLPIQVESRLVRRGELVYESTLIPIVPAKIVHGLPPVRRVQWQQGGKELLEERRRRKSSTLSILEMSFDETSADPTEPEDKPADNFFLPDHEEEEAASCSCSDSESSVASSVIWVSKLPAAKAEPSGPAVEKTKPRTHLHYLS